MCSEIVPLEGTFRVLQGTTDQSSLSFLEYASEHSAMDTKAFIY